MWTVVKLDSSINFNKICHSIKKDIIDKLVKENIPVEGKFLFIELKEPSATIEPEKPKITGF